MHTLRHSFSSPRKYITQPAEQVLRDYKYAGEDRSIIYQNVLRPLNLRLVNYFPLWLAPNLITLTGLCVTLSSHILTALYSPSFDRILPTWLNIYCGISLVAYQTLDNLDGGQARRTQSSSPLGLLFDHGVDALNCTVGALMQATVFQLNSGGKLIGLWSLTFIPFVFATWEEYYTNTLILPTINGPTDGVLLCVLFSFIAAVYPGFWEQPFGFNFPFLHNSLLSSIVSYPTHYFILAVGGFSVFLTILSNCYNVHKKRSLFTSSSSSSSPLSTLFPFLWLYFLALIWFFFSPTQVFASRPRLFLFTIGFLFCNLVCKLMLAHLCNYEYKVFRTVLIPLTLCVANSLLPVLFGRKTLPFQLLNEEQSLYLALIFNFSCWLHFVVHVVKEIKAALQIRCFHIAHKKSTQVQVANGTKARAHKK